MFDFVFLLHRLIVDLCLLPSRSIILCFDPVACTRWHCLVTQADCGFCLIVLSGCTCVDYCSQYSLAEVELLFSFFLLTTSPVDCYFCFLMFLFRCMCFAIFTACHHLSG